MKGITVTDQKAIENAIEKGWELFLDKGIKGWDEEGNKKDVPARIMNEYGGYVASVKTTLPENEEFTNYREEA